MKDFHYRNQFLFLYFDMTSSDNCFVLQGQVRVPEGVSECQVWSKAVDSSYNVQEKIHVFNWHSHVQNLEIPVHLNFKLGIQRISGAKYAATVGLHFLFC